MICTHKNTAPLGQFFILANIHGHAVMVPLLALWSIRLYLALAVRAFSMHEKVPKGCHVSLSEKRAFLPIHLPAAGLLSEARKGRVYWPHQAVVSGC